MNNEVKFTISFTACVEMMVLKDEVKKKSCFSHCIAIIIPFFFVFFFRFFFVEAFKRTLTKNEKKNDRDCFSLKIINISFINLLWLHITARICVKREKKSKKFFLYFYVWETFRHLAIDKRHLSQVQRRICRYLWLENFTLPVILWLKFWEDLRIKFCHFGMRHFSKCSRGSILMVLSFIAKSYIELNAELIVWGWGCWKHLKGGRNF